MAAKSQLSSVCGSSVCPGQPLAGTMACIPGYGHGPSSMATRTAVPACPAFACALESDACMYSSLTAGFTVPREYSNCTGLGTIWSGRINIGHYSVVPGVHSGSCARCAARWPFGVPLGRVLQHTMCVRVGHVWSVRRGMCSERFPVWSRYGGAAVWGRRGLEERRVRRGRVRRWKEHATRRAGAGRVQRQSPVSGGGQRSAES